MTIRLAKTLDKMKMYDEIYDLCNEPFERVEEYFIEEGNLPYLLEHFVDQVNSECGTLLDDGDYDFLDVEQCTLLKSWIITELEAGVPEQIQAVYGVMLNYIDRAIPRSCGIANNSAFLCAKSSGKCKKYYVLSIYDFINYN